MHVLKWVGLGFLGLVFMIVLVVGGLLAYGQTVFRAYQPERPLVPIQADASPEGLARGEYLATSVMGCTGACHTPKGGQPLSGDYQKIEMGLVSVDFAVPNLTPDVETGLGGWSDAEIARAIREGVGQDGRALVIMPSFNYHTMSDADIAALIAYLRSLAPVQHTIPDYNANIFGKTMVVMGAFGPASLGAPILAPVEAPPEGTTAYGAYLVSLGGCRDCHGMDLSGGKSLEPGAPPAPDLTPGGELVSWSEADFLHALRDGFRPDGRLINPSYMPWKEYGRMTDADLALIYQYLQSLPAQTRALAN